MKANKHLLLWASLGTLLVLVLAAYAENFRQEWRVLQREYQSLLPADKRADFSLQLRQVVVPALDAADRCVTCHLGMAAGEDGIDGHPVFAPHPDVVHDPSAYGCTACHGGQGRATTRDDAHGEVAHWPAPMIPRRFAFAGCGTCHTHLEVPNLAHLERGKALFERYDCLTCHRMDDRGGTLRPGDRHGMEGPDLSRVGARESTATWYDDHLARREATSTAMPVSDGPSREQLWRDAFGRIPPEDVAALNVFLDSRVGAPGLIESKALFHTLGCRGCHPLGGVGGDDGPDLTREGQRDPGQLDFSAVPGGGRSLAAWLAEHFRSPAMLVAGSEMPSLGLDDDAIDDLTFYMLSLRRSDYAEAFWPRDRIRAERFGEREFATDGATLYGTFCAACHGPRGEGMRYPGMAAFPAIGNPDFLELVSDDFLRMTVRRGRPGRRMPAWGELDGGLRPAEIEAVVSHVRTLGGGARPAGDDSAQAAFRIEGDALQGATLYATHCASCHGPAGEGNEGPALGNRVLLETASDSYLFDTIARGRDGTSMPSFTKPSPVRQVLARDEIASIVAYVRSWEDRR